MGTTVKKYAKENKITRSQADYRLKKRWKEDDLKRKKEIVDRGGLKYIYYDEGDTDEQ